MSNIVEVEWQLKRKDGSLLDIKGVPQIQLRKLSDSCSHHSIIYRFTLTRVGEFIRKIYIRKPKNFKCARLLVGDEILSETSTLNESIVETFRHPHGNSDGTCSSLCALVDQNYRNKTHRCYDEANTIDNLFEIPLFETEVLIPSRLAYCTPIHLEVTHTRLTCKIPKIYVETVFMDVNERTRLEDSTFSQDIYFGGKLVKKLIVKDRIAVIKNLNG